MGSEEAVELQPEGHHSHTLRASDSEAKKILTLPFADGQDLRGGGGKAALDCQENMRRSPAEVAAEDMPMERVNDDGNAGELGGNAAKGAGLGSVGMDDLRLLLPEQPEESEKGDEVATRSDLAPKLWEEQWLDALFCGEISQGALARPFAPSHQQGFVSAGAQTSRQQDGVDRRAPDVEAADDPADANGVTHVA